MTSTRGLKIIDIITKDGKIIGLSEDGRVCYLEDHGKWVVRSSSEILDPVTAQKLECEIGDTNFKPKSYYDVSTDEVEVKSHKNYLFYILIPVGILIVFAGFSLLVKYFN